MSRLTISDEVRAALPTGAIERMIAHREHTELTCSECGRVVLPEASDTVSVILRFDAMGLPVVHYAHATCSSSRIDRSYKVRRPAEVRFSYIPFLLRRRDVSALLVWEPLRASFDAETSEDVTVKVYRELGFKPSEAGIGSTSGPVLSTLLLAGDGTQLRLLHDEAPLQEFDDMAGVEPPGWLEVARRQRRCLLVVGETLGLDRFSEARLDAMLADGRAVAAVALTKISR